MDTSDKINDMIDECIKALVDDNIQHGADQLYELAVLWAQAGLPQTSFNDMRGYIIQQAENRTDARFIREKLKIIERENYDRRNRTCKSSKIIQNNTKTIH